PRAQRDEPRGRQPAGRLRKLQLLPVFVLLLAYGCVGSTRPAAKTPKTAPHPASRPKPRPSPPAPVPAPEPAPEAPPPAAAPPAAPAAPETPPGSAVPVRIRVGLASDLASVTLPCCSSEATVSSNDQ